MKPSAEPKVAGPPITINRKQYDAYLREMARAMGVPEANVESLVACEYPKSIIDVIIECRARGFMAGDGSAYAYAKKYLRQRAGIFLWMPSDIDDYCDQLAKRNRFTERAVLAGAAGISAEQLISSALDGFRPCEPATTKAEPRPSHN